MKLGFIGRKMSFKSKKRRGPPPVRIPNPPKPQEIMDVFDEISGVKSIVVRDAKGRLIRKNMRMPRTPQEQKFFEQGEKLVSEGMKSIKQLYQYNPQNVIDIMPVINTITSLNQKQAEDISKIADFGNIQKDIEDFRGIQKDILNKELLKRRGYIESDLLRSGLKDSTYAAEQRAFFDNEAEMSRRMGDLQATQYGEDLAKQRLGRNLLAYDARQQVRDNELRGAQQEYALRQQKASDAENMRQRAIEERMNQINMGNALMGIDRERAGQNNAAMFSLAENQIRNRNQMEDYNSRVNAMNQNYQNQLGYHQNMNAQRRDYGGLLGNVAGTVGGSMLFGPVGSGGNKLFGKLFG